jgi:predicted nucleotidyltransferase component of viral defense system
MYNFTKKELDIAAQQTGFIRDNLEKVFRLCNILRYLSENKLFANNLALKGGTAINLTVFNLPRLSVDIDFDFSTPCSRDEMFVYRERINSELLNYMFSEGYALSPNTKNPHSLDSWAFYFQNAAGNRDVIKIEINYSNRTHVLPLENKTVRFDDYIFEIKINTLSTLELFGSKINALISRTAPRDIYDVHNMLNRQIIPTEKQALLRKIVVFYLAVGGKNKIVNEINFDKIITLKYRHFRDNLIPLLRKTEKFDFEQAKVEVLNYISDLMTLTGKEKSFVENFNNGNYQPEWLFDDAEIAERIKEHPMAIWKTKITTDKVE